MICFVFRPRRQVDGKIRISRTWHGKFQLPGDAKPTVVGLGVSDKQVAQEKLRETVRAIERERAGLARVSVSEMLLRSRSESASASTLISNAGSAVMKSTFANWN